MVAVLLAGVLVWNAVALGYAPVDTADAPRADVPWDMFAPMPPDSREWVVAPGRTVDGERVDAYEGTRLSPGENRWNRPPTAYRSVRWRKYVVSLVWGEEPRLVHPFAAGLCARWDRTHVTELENVTVYAVREPVRIDGPPGERERRRLVEHDCRTG